MNNKYPKRTNYNEELGDGKACHFDFDLNFCVTVQWNGKKYVITHAWKETDILKLRATIDYPFVRSANDRKKVLTIIQTNCDHQWDYYPEHACCLTCGIDKKGNFQKEYDIQQKKDQAEISKDFTVKACHYRIRTFKLNPAFTMERFHTRFIITKNWICLLENNENHEFFRKKCTEARKAKCKHPL